MHKTIISLCTPIIRNGKNIRTINLINSTNKNMKKNKDKKENSYKYMYINLNK